MTWLAETGDESGIHPPAQGDATENEAPGPASCRVALPDGQPRFTLRHHDHVRHELQQGGAEYVRQFRETPGTITTQGMFLAGSSIW